MLAISAIKKSKGGFFEDVKVRENFSNHKEVVIAAVKQKGILIEYASHELKNSKQIAINGILSVRRVVIFQDSAFTV